MGTPATYGSEGASGPMDRPWETAFFKDPIEGDCFLSETNLEGDRQADLEYHGGPDKAVCVYPIEHYEYWTDRLDLNLDTAAFGENFTIEELTEQEACIGDIFEVGDATVQITLPRSPCWKLARRWRVLKLAILFEESGYTGWFLYVLETGTVAPGQKMCLVDCLNPEWPVARATKVRYRMPNDREFAGELASLDALGDSWTEKLRHREETGEQLYSETQVIGPNMSNPQLDDPEEYL